jgi:WD40 repeat protein
MAEVPQVARKGAHAGKARPSAPLPSTTVHWHASPVGCLSFSPDGVYLLSGGAEQVLVMWQLEGSKPKFLPRCVVCITAGWESMRVAQAHSLAGVHGSLAWSPIQWGVLGRHQLPLRQACSICRLLLEARAMKGA